MSSLLPPHPQRAQAASKLLLLLAIEPATIRVLMLCVNLNLAESAAASILWHMKIPRRVLHASRAAVLVATGAGTAPASRLTPPATQSVRPNIMFVVLARTVVAALAVASAMPTMQIVAVSSMTVDVEMLLGLLTNSSGLTLWRAREAASRTSPNLLGGSTDEHLPEPGSYCLTEYHTLWAPAVLVVLRLESTTIAS